MDEVAHAFQMERIKRDVNQCDNVESLRNMVLTLVDVMERQKAMFRQLIHDFEGTKKPRKPASPSGS